MKALLCRLLGHRMIGHYLVLRNDDEPGWKFQEDGLVCARCPHRVPTNRSRWQVRS